GTVVNLHRSAMRWDGTWKDQFGPRLRVTELRMLGPRPREGGPSSRDHDSQTWLAILNQMPIGVTVLEIPDSLFILQNSVARELLGRDPGLVGADAYLHYGGPLHDR